MAKTLLKVAAIINFVIGGLILLVSLLLFGTGFLAIFGMIGGAIAAVRLAIGATFYSVSNKQGDEFSKRRGYVLAASIASILTGHVITFILGIIAYTDMNSNETIKEERKKRILTEEEKAEKRLRSLLALGCGLVLLAGIIFAVTTWTTLSGFGKTVALIVATIIFLGLSYFSENKFKLKKSSITYYILANAFFIFSFVAAGYFNVFGDWFSVNGDGRSLYFVFLWVITAVLSYVAYLKYDKKGLFYIFDFSILMVLVFLLNFIKLERDIILLMVILVSSIFALMPKKSEVISKAVNLSNIVLIISSVVLFSFISELNSGDRVIFNLISFGIVFVTTYYLAIINKNTVYEVFSPIFTIGTAFLLSVVTGVESKIIFLQLILITLIIYSIGYYFRDRKILFSVTAISSDIALLYIFIDALKLNYNYYALIAAILLFGSSLAVMVSKKFSRYHFEIVLEPVKVILLAFAIYKLIYRFDYTEDALFFAIVALIFAVVCIFRKNFMRSIYFIGGLLLTVSTMFINISEFAPIAHILNILALSVLLILAFRGQDKLFSQFKEVIYGLLLVGVAAILLNTFRHFEMKFLGMVVLALIYTVLAVVFRRDRILRCFTIVGLLVPYVSILPISVFNDNVNYILYSLPWLALIFIYTRSFMASVSLKSVNIIEIATLSIWYLAVSSEVSLEIAIFIGVISFVALLIGYRSEKWISLYYTGVAFLILNTLIQLNEFWTSIPIWAYILVAGLILIGIVTYKEYSKVNKDEAVEKVEAEIVSKPSDTFVKASIDRRAIAMGTILYIVVIPILLEIIS